MPLLVQLILTGMSEGGKDDGGAVVFMDKRKHSIVRKVGFAWKGSGYRTTHFLRAKVNV